MARYTANAFIEDRAGENVSADRMWPAGTTSQKQIEWVTKKLTSIAANEGDDKLVGWAACEAGDIRKANAVDDVLPTSHDKNPRHADIVKLAGLLILETDDARLQKKKTLIVAQSLSECFNSSGTFVSKAAPAAPTASAAPATAEASAAPATSSASVSPATSPSAAASAGSVAGASTELAAKNAHSSVADKGTSPHEGESPGELPPANGD